MSSVTKSAQRKRSAILSHQRETTCAVDTKRVSVLPPEIKRDESLRSLRIIRLPEVMHRTGLSRPTIYAKIAKGVFPRQVSLGGNSVGWREYQIDEWIENLPEAGGR